MAVFLRKIKTFPQRLLLVRPDALGDLLQTLPAMEAISRKMLCYISVLCHSCNAPVLQGNPLINQIILWDSEKATDEIINGHFDVVINFYSQFKFPVTINNAFLTIPKRVGVVKNFSMMKQWNYPILQRRSFNLQSEALYSADLLYIFKSVSKLSIKKPRLFWQQNELDLYKEKFSFLQRKAYRVVLHYRFGGSSPMWTEQQYDTLVHNLLLEGATVLFIGFLEEEKQFHEKLTLKYSVQFPSKVINTTGQLTLRELAGVMYYSHLYIGGSTGPTHVASSIGLPIIGIYSPLQVTSEVRWAPYLYEGSILTPNVICKEKYKCSGKLCPYYYCMNRITLDLVMRKVRERRQLA